MKRFLLMMTALVGLGFASSAHATDLAIDLTPGLTGGGMAMTNWVFRGVTQTQGRAAGSIFETYNYNGFFEEVAVTNSKVGNNNFETDLFLGYKTKLTDKLIIQTNVQYYSYPGTSQYGNVSMVEWQNAINYAVTDKITAFGGFAISPQWQFHSGMETYTNIGADVNLPLDFTGSASVGYSTFANENVSQNYLDWQVAISHQIVPHLMGTLQYTGTDGMRRSSVLGGGNTFVGLLTVSF